METKYKVLAGVLALVASFAFGRYSARSPKIEQTAKTTEDKVKQVDKDQNLKRTTTTVKEVDGKTTTTTVEERDTKTIVHAETKIDTAISTTITPSHATVSVSALIGADLADRKGFVYGASITKEMLGPITLGVWGLSNGTVGGSIGLTF